jgi:hypothetical protein
MRIVQKDAYLQICNRQWDVPWRKCEHGPRKLMQRGRWGWLKWTSWLNTLDGVGWCDSFDRILGLWALTVECSKLLFIEEHPCLLQAAPLSHVLPQSQYSLIDITIYSSPNLSKLIDDWQLNPLWILVSILPSQNLILWQNSSALITISSSVYVLTRWILIHHIKHHINSILREKDTWGRYGTMM